MPGTKDFAALPTSWALTIWDALPVVLTVEAALAIVILAAFAGRSRALLWRLSSSLVAGGLAYLLLFESALSLPFALIALAHLGVELRRIDAPRVELPRSVGAGLKARAWEVIGAVAGSGALAAIVKILLAPYLASDNPAWILIAIGGGFIPVGPLGAAALPALAITNATDSTLIGALWLATAAVRPLILARRPGRSAEPAEARGGD